MVVRTKLLLPLAAFVLALACAAPALADEMGKGMGNQSQGAMSQGGASKMSAPMGKGSMSQTPSSGAGGNMSKSNMSDQNGGSAGMSPGEMSK
jgi:hypothetical protein